MNIVFLGAGRVAWHLAQAYRRSGCDILQVYSRTLQSATALADRVGAQAVCSLDDITTEADVFIIALTDDVVGEVAGRLCPSRQHALFLHTSGSQPLKVLSRYARRCGVLYPMQTFSKQQAIDVRSVPFFCEGNSSEATAATIAVARIVSDKVMELSTEGRRSLHLAAVFACNFANHCYAIADSLLTPYGIPFATLLPLIDETARKIHTISPQEAQTGPAVRGDSKTMTLQHDLLAAHPQWQQVYDIMSKDIMREIPKNE